MADDVSREKISFDLSVIDLLNFGGPNMMRNGDEVYKSSHLLSCGILSAGDKTCTIEAQCLQSSHPDQAPHSITINTAEKFKDFKFHCSCKAGNGGRCKHIYAALLHIHIEKSLPFFSSTERKQYWGKVAKVMSETVLEPELIRELKEMKLFERDIYEVTRDELDYCEKLLLSDKKAAIAIFLERANTMETEPSIANINDLACCDNNESERRAENALRELMRTLYDFTFNLRVFFLPQLPKNELNFYNKRICLGLEQAIELSVKSRDQKNSLWHSERKIRITASECYSLYTASKNPNVDWEKKMCNYFKPKPNLQCFVIGHREEPFALKLYERQKQCYVTKIGLDVHPSFPWFGCSPDGFVCETKTVVEVKTLMNEKNEDFSTALKSVSYLGGKEGCYFLRQKHKFYAQIQINIHLLRATKADLVIHNYKSQEIRVINVGYDQNFVNELISSLKPVYFTHVLPYVFHTFNTLEDQKKYD